MPCLNSEDTIATQLNALSNQNWSGPWEVIVSDGGSTDHTLKIVEQYKDRINNLHIVNASDRRGCAYARNVAAKVATGEVLAFCDADDEVGKNWLSTLGMALLKYDFVACRTDIDKLNTNWIKKTRLHFQKDRLIVHSFPSFFPHAAGGTLGVKRWLHEAVGGFNESLLVLEDTDYCWRIQLKGIELHFVSNAVVHYRYRNTFRDMYRQSSNYGMGTIILYRKYQQFGIPKISRKKEMLSWVSLIKKLIKIRDKGDLASWIWRLGWRMGRLKGNIAREILT